jgi:hypothetical protein
VLEIQVQCLSDFELSVLEQVPDEAVPSEEDHDVKALPQFVADVFLDSLVVVSPSEAKAPQELMLPVGADSRQATVWGVGGEVEDRTPSEVDHFDPAQTALNQGWRETEFPQEASHG